MGLQPKTVTIEIVFPSMEISKWQEHFQSERQKICRKHHLSLSVQSYLDFISHRLNGPKLEIKVTSQPIDYIPGYTSGFIAIPRAIVLELGLRGDYGAYFVDLIVRAMRAGYDVVEVPYVCVPRQRGVSKTSIGLLRHGVEYLATTFALWWELRRPAR